MKNNEQLIDRFKERLPNWSREDIAKGKLMRFAQYLGRVRRPDAEGIRLYVYGATNSQDSFFQTALAKKRAQAFDPIKNRPVEAKIGPALKLPKLLND